MRIWGYLLIFLNLVAAGAFVYYAFAVRKARTEWQFALLKQELINRGLPLEAPDHPGDVDADSVPFDFPYSATEVVKQDKDKNLFKHNEELSIKEITKKKLKDLIPAGGEVLGTKSEIVSNQTQEVQRVEKIIFAELENLTPAEKRQRLMILLLNLSKNSSRIGVYALLRDLPDQRLRDRSEAAPAQPAVLKEEPARLQIVKDSKARMELAFLGRTGAQQAALTALAHLGEVEFAYGANVSQKVKDELVLKGRIALGEWAKGEVSLAVPYPVPPSSARGEEAYDTAKKAAEAERKTLREALDPFLKEVQKATPDPMLVEDGKQRISKASITSPAAAALLPYLAEVGGNLLNTPEDLAAAKTKLMELLNVRATTESEKKSLAATVDLMMPAESRNKEFFAKKIDTAALELLKAYFEEATWKASADFEKKPLRDPGEKKRNIAHLLYHLDANMKRAERADWHARVAAIVGLEAYISATEAQASQLADLWEKLHTRIVEDQIVFEREYDAIKTNTLSFSRILATRKEELAKQVYLQQEATTQLTIRETERDDLKNELDRVTAVAATALSDLGKKVDELFRITKQLGEAQDALVGLEIQLRDMEIPKSAPKK